MLQTKLVDHRGSVCKAGLTWYGDLEATEDVNAPVSGAYGGNEVLDDQCTSTDTQ